MPVVHADFSQDQRHAYDAIVGWFRGSPRLLTLGGYAGTGKTTLLAEIARFLKKNRKPPRIAYCCLAGKASNVLRGKIVKAAAMGQDDYCGTIHGLIYRRVHNGWARVPQREMFYDLIVLDEASMPDERTFEDLSSYGVPILAVGDHGQLPPIRGTFNLMERPDLKLETIHRQAESSPIIRVSMMARLDGRIPVGRHGEGVFKTTDDSMLERLRDPKAGMILCGINRTRNRLNAMLRRKCGHKSAEPEVGDRLICLRNDHEEGVYNGMVGELKAIGPCGDPTHGGQHASQVKRGAACAFHWNASIAFPDNDIVWRGDILREQFGAAKTIQKHPNLKWGEIGGLYDYGYALTTHKAQGSEADNVVVVEETDHMDTEDQKRRWLYTAVTRAKRNLAIIGRS